jgi:hypothetical protein
MDDGVRINVGVLAVVLVASCGGAGPGGTAGSHGTGGKTGAAGDGGGSGRGALAGAGGAAGGGGAGGAAGGGGAGGACSTCRTLTLEIDAHDLVYSATRNELYASVGSSATTYPNTIVVVDPATASVLSTIPTGSDPGVLALSDDGSTLWVGLQGAHAICKVSMNPTPPVVGPPIQLPEAGPGAPFDAASMAVLPGAPLSVVVVLSDGSFTNEVHVYDDGGPRATGATSLPGSPFYVSSIIAGPPGTAFGLVGGERSFYVHSVSPSGVTATPIALNLVRDAQRDSLAWVGTRVFSGGGGDVIDVTSPAAPFSVGQLPFPGLVARRDPSSVMRLSIMPLPSPSVEKTDLRIYSSDTLAELATIAVPENVGALYSRLVYAGGDAAAFLRHGGSIAYPPLGLMIVHHPALTTPIGSGGVSGASGSGAAGMGGAGP